MYSLPRKVSLLYLSVNVGLLRWIKTFLLQLVAPSLFNDSKSNTRCKTLLNDMNSHEYGYVKVILLFLDTSLWLLLLSPSPSSRFFSSSFSYPCTFFSSPAGKCNLEFLLISVSLFFSSSRPSCSLPLLLSIEVVNLVTAINKTQHETMVISLAVETTSRALSASHSLTNNMSTVSPRLFIYFFFPSSPPNKRYYQLKCFTSVTRLTNSLSWNIIAQESDAFHFTRILLHSLFHWSEKEILARMRVEEGKKVSCKWKSENESERQLEGKLKKKIRIR